MLDSSNDSAGNASPPVASRKRSHWVYRILAFTFIALTFGLAGQNPKRAATSVSWVSHELQGYSMRVWMNNGLEMGLQAWDRVSFPPVGLEYPAGSQIEHLSAGAPLVAGIVNGVRHVSSAF